MRILHMFIEPREQFISLGRESSRHRPAILAFPAARDEPALFQPVEESSNVGVPGDHSVTDFATRKTVRSAAQNPQHIVLVQRKVFLLQ